MRTRVLLVNETMGVVVIIAMHELRSRPILILSRASERQQ